MLADTPSALLTQDEGDARYYTQAQSDGRYPLKTDTDPYPQYYNQARADARYLQISTATATYSPLTHNHDAAYSPAAHDHDAAYLQLTGGTLSGVLRVNANVGVGVAPAAWASNYAAVQVGPWASLTSITNQPWTLLSHNSYGGGSGATALATGAASRIFLDANTINLENAPSVAAGATQTMTRRASIGATGTLSLMADTGTPPLAVGATVSGYYARQTMRIGYAGFLSAENTGINLQIGANNRYDGSGNYAAVTGPSSFIGLGANGFDLWTAPSVGAGVAQAFSQILNISPTGTVTLTPSAVAQVVWIGTSRGASPIIVFGDPYTRIGNDGSFGLMEIGAAAYGIDTRVNGVRTYMIRTDGITPEPDNTKHCGSPSNRFSYMSAVNGVIQTSHVSMKEAFGPLDPALCAQAVLETDWVAFSYLPPQYVEPGEVPEADATSPEQREAWLDAHRAAHVKYLADTQHVRRQKGYVLQSPAHKTHALFGLEDRASTSPGSDLAVVACALQQALQRISVLETHILALEAR